MVAVGYRPHCTGPHGPVSQATCPHDINAAVPEPRWRAHLQTDGFCDQNVQAERLSEIGSGRLVAPGVSALTWR